MKHVVPWRRSQKDELRNRFDRVFDQFFTDPWSALTQAGDGRRDLFFAPPVEISENEKEITVRAELPGVDPQNVNVELLESVLSITGQREDRREEKEGQSTFSEFVFGGFRREVALPTDVDPDSVKATFEKGILHVNMQKSQASRSRRINVESR